MWTTVYGICVHDTEVHNNTKMTVLVVKDFTREISTLSCLKETPNSL